MRPIETPSMRRVFFFVILLFAVYFVMANYVLFMTANGHAGPIAYNPQPNQIINATRGLPDEVTITFNERPEEKASIIEVLNLNNTRIDNNEIKLGNSDNILTVSLNKSKMIPGIYFVKWLVLSKDDGFITKNSYTFSYTLNNK